MSTDETTLTFRVPETDFDGVTVEVGLIAVAEAMQARPGVERGLTPSPYGALGAAYRVLRTVHCRYLDAVGADFSRYPEDPLKVEVKPRD